MKIGISSKNVLDFFDKRINSENFKILEINRCRSHLGFNMERLAMLAEKFKEHKIETTLHSASYSIFHDNPMIHEAQVLNLKSEILQAKQLNCKEIVFHLANKEPDQNDINLLKELAVFAKKHDVILLLENDAKGYFANEENILKTITSIENLFLALDIGHLKLAKLRGLVKSESAFINKLNDKITYAHIHDNCGKIDSHSALGSDIERYKKILRLLPNNIKLIMETNYFDEAVKSKKIITEILDEINNNSTK
ncbi:sugar phosphate isomerase/epimerase [Candidatus Woesearchaeota archaeon]|nr:sugar phosphate isomerase/epimerase [Candidatus Woesearchaeota archaeon]